MVHAKRKAHAESSCSDVEVVETEGTTWTNLSILLNSAGQSCYSFRQNVHPAFQKTSLLWRRHSRTVVLRHRRPAFDNLIEIDDDDEWSTGDDELVRAKFDDEVLELIGDDDQVVEDVLKVEADEPPYPVSGADNVLNQCPFCRRALTRPSVFHFFQFILILVASHVSLSHQDIQSHLNDCCDSA